MAFQIEKLLEFMIANKGSDMILSVGHPPHVRISGSLKGIAKTELNEEDVMGLVKSITGSKYLKEFEESGSTDFAYSFQEKARFRVSVYRQKGFAAMVLRLIPQDIFSFEQLGFSETLQKQTTRPRGLFLVTGPTGSGKTTTLSSIIHHINQTAYKHILTIEDPVEFLHKPAKSVISQREVGEDVPSFSEALRRALRQNPDIIFVGEMRDLETISIAITAAETGHLVMGTLHTTSAYATISRIIDVFPAGQQDMVRTQLATALNVVVCQQLLPRVGGGRIAAQEVMIVNSGIRGLIRDNKIHQIPSAIQTSSQEGNFLLDEQLYHFFIENLITKEDMFDKCQDTKALQIRVDDWEAEQERLLRVEEKRNKKKSLLGV